MIAEHQEQNGNWITPGGMNFVVNTLSLLCVSVLAITGLIVLKHLHGDESLLGFRKHAWEELHERFGVLMVVLVGYHLVRHRKWLTALFNGQLLGSNASRKRTWITLGIAILAMAIIAVGSIFEG